ncbi:MAG: glycosyltransferase family 2 protein [Desulfobacterales bacterium]|nr:glycosyltransferase family 2 protein [Desulfobacterales bacterium]MBF0396553.1 glycosyltransferase family 2 protein [Desulfobacterales bacterium]
MEKLTVAIIAKNEADRISTLLKSASFADEILVIDSGSTDGTQELCKNLGAHVIFNEWQGYAAQKQFAMEQASSEWVLSLDADEEISEELAKEIKNAITYAKEDVSAFSMPRLSKYLGQWIRHGGWYPDRKVRLIRREKGKWEGTIHEKLIVDGKTEKLYAPIFHYTYRGIKDQLVTINSFTEIFAENMGPKSGFWVFWGLIRAFIKFFECYIYKLGILDGIAGFIIAVNSSWAVFLRYAKAWELNLIKKE